eukprot:4732814-Prymnesium_polylepis.3
MPGGVGEGGGYRVVRLRRRHTASSAAPASGTPGGWSETGSGGGDGVMSPTMRSPAGRREKTLSAKYTSLLVATRWAVHAGPRLGRDVGLADGVRRLHQPRPRLASERLDVHNLGSLAGECLVARDRVAVRRARGAVV